MMKWLRAHSKQIMVVTVLLAMFSFVGGSALVGILSPSQDKDPVLKAFGREYLRRDLQLAQMDTEVLNRIGVNWQYDGDGRISVEGWFILSEEARRNGFAVSDAEIDQTLKTIQDDFTQRGGGNLMETLRVQYHIAPPQVRHALAEHLAIMKNASYLGAAATPSEPQVRHFVRDTEDKVKVQFAGIDAEKFMDPNLPLSAEQVQAQFDKYKDVDRATPSTGYGYKLPRRVKLQYVVANLKTVESQINVSFEDVKNHWKTNKSKYHKVVYEQPAPESQPAASQPTSAASQPATQPVAKSVEKTLTEARPDIERELRKKNAQRLCEQSMTKIASALQKPWLEEKIDPDTGYKPIAAGVQAPNYFQETCQRYAREVGVALEWHETGLLAAEDIETNADLRGATLSGEGAEGLKLSELAFRVPPFFKHEKGSETTVSLQLFQASDVPLVASDINLGKAFRGWQPSKDRLVVFRVIEADDAHPPAALDEVRAQVERDLRIEAAMKSIEPTVKELYAAARKLGLKEAWSLFDDLHKKLGRNDLWTPAPFARLAPKSGANYRDILKKGESMFASPDVAGVGVSSEFVDACLEMAADGWTSPDAETPSGDRAKLVTTRPAASPSPVVRMVALPKRGKWCVVERLGVERVDQGKFDSQLRNQGYQQLVGQRGAYLVAQWFTPRNIEARCGFERIQVEPVGRKTTEGITEQPVQHPMLDF